MKPNDFIKMMDSLLPRSLSEEWDNDGCMVCSDPFSSVKKCLTCLDVDEGALSFAVQNGFDTVVSHHPLIFSKLSSLDLTSPNVSSEALVCAAVKSGVNVFSYHTRLDKARGGLNDFVASMIGMENVCVFCEDDGLMRCGAVGDTTLFELAGKCREKLGLAKIGYPVLVYGEDRKISKAALVTGSGSEYVRMALDAGADVLISGDLKYHDVSLALSHGIACIDAGHDGTERAAAELLKQMIESASGSEVSCTVYHSPCEKHCVI